MGFCLFEEVNEDGYCMAVNPACVDDIELIGETKQGWPVSLLVFGFKIKSFKPIVLGVPDDIHKILMKGVKIGMEEIGLRNLTGQSVLQAVPMLFSRPDRIALIKERQLCDLKASFIPAQTASTMIMDDGSEKLIIDRPGTCAFKANAENNVPFLNIRKLGYLERA